MCVATPSSSNGEEELTIPRVLITFGSETGAAEAAAGRLGRTLRSVKPLVMPLNKVCGLEIVKKHKITHMLVLCSTFGEGKPPSSAAKFFETEIPDGLLKNTFVATLALGSSMYPDFCAAGKKLDKMLSSAGGQELAPITIADDAEDSLGSVASWIHLMKNLVCPHSLELAIEAQMGAASEPLRYTIKWQSSGESLDMIKRFQWPVEQSALCIVNEELLGGGDITKPSKRRIGFQLPPGMSYTTGDHLCVYPLNGIDMVERFGACFALEFAGVQTNKVSDVGDLVKWQLQQPFEVVCLDNGQEYPAQLCFSTPCTLGEVLQTSVSLSLTESVVTDVIGVVMEYLNFDCDDPVLCQFKELSGLLIDVKESETYQDAMDSFLSLFPTVVDLLEAIVPRISRCGQKPIALGHLLSILPRLQPRFYTISSSGSTTAPYIVEAIVEVVHSVTDDGVEIAGVCSNYLAHLQPGKDRARISIRMLASS